MVNSQGLILDKTRHKGVRQHDYHLYKHNHPVTPSQAENIVDLGEAYSNGGRSSSIRFEQNSWRAGGSKVSFSTT
jgi:hypothetical protein